MGIFIAVALLIVGLILCVKGSDIFVDSAKWLATATGISCAVIGATVVAFSTSAPELFITLFASLRGHADLAIGNIVGSEAVNVGIGIAIVAIALPGCHKDKLFMFRAIIMVVTLFMLLAFALTGAISWVHGIFFLLVFVVFCYANIRYSKDSTCPPRQKTSGKEITINIIKFIIGIAAVLFGAHLVVDSASYIAIEWGMSEALVGVTIVAAGTSLPEILTCIQSVRKKEYGMAIGSIVGSSIFNIALVLGIVSIASGAMPVPTTMARIEIPIIALMSLVVVIPSLLTKKIHRWQGYVLLALYATFLTFAIINS